MWDIKPEKKVSADAVTKFYLNHVGYKESIKPQETDEELTFYLNHVGYKEPLHRQAQEQ